VAKATKVSTSQLSGRITDGLCVFGWFQEVKWLALKVLNALVRSACVSPDSDNASKHATHVTAKTRWSLVWTQTPLDLGNSRASPWAETRVTRRGKSQEIT
jgi:hypothetical protein